MLIAGVEHEGTARKEGKEFTQTETQGAKKDKQGKKKLIFLQECSRNTMLCLMDTLTVKDTVKQGESQLKISFKFCYLKCLAPEMRLNSLIWKSFRALLPQRNEI